MMTPSRPRWLLRLAPAMLLAACSDDARDTAAPEAAETPIPVEPGGGIGDGATPLPEAADEPEGDFAMTMPTALRGQWREDDLGRAPTAEDCNQTSQTNRNFGKVLSVRDDGYGLFETGGRIMEVHNRTDSMIDATFDTTYADEPTQARRDFALQPDGTLAVNDDDGDGRMTVTQYRPCRTGG